MFRYITHPFATRHQDYSRAAVRLACVKHAASVQSEPGSNSSVQSSSNFKSRLLRPDWSHSKRIYFFVSSFSVSYFFYVLSRQYHLLSQIILLFPSAHTHTNRLFYLNFKELSIPSSTAVAAKRCALYRLNCCRQLYFYFTPPNIYYF